MSAIPDKGLIFDLSRERYDRIDRVRWSRLKVMGKSPAHYNHACTAGPEKDTSAKALGRAAHVAALEPEKFAAQYVTWTGERRAGKEWEKFCAKHEGAEILRAEDAEFCRAIQQAVRNDPHARRVLTGGRAEATLLWTDEATGIECKARPDFVADAGVLVDLKTTLNASVDGFGKEIWKYAYHCQAAFYVDGYEAVTGVAAPFYFVAVEKSAPFVVQVYQVPEVALELGRETYRAYLERLKECRAASRWPGYHDGVTEAVLPRWAVDFAEDDNLGELDLVINGAASAEA